MGLMIMNGVEYSGGADKVAIGGRIDTLDDTIRTAVNTSYELVASIQNYDVILIILGYNGDDIPYCGSFDIPVRAIEYNRDFWVAGGNVDRAIRMCFTDATHYTMEYVRETNRDCVLGVYGIKYGFIGDAGLHKYSTDEQVVGTWIDGKPLYEKSYITPQFSNTGYDIETDIPFAIAFVYTGCYLLNDANGSMIGLNEWFADANRSFCHVEKNTKKIRCYLFGYTGIGYITIRYTKTTD